MRGLLEKYFKIRLRRQGDPNPTRILWFTIGMIIVSTLAFNSGFGRFVQNKITHPVNFIARIQAGKDPTFNKNIRIYAIDDTTVNYLQAADLHLSEWGRLIKAIGESKPKAIYIDKLFGAGYPKEVFAEFKDQISSLETPVVVGSYFTSSKIPFKQPLPFTKPGFDLKAHSKDQSVYSAEVPAFLQIKPAYLYGPHPEVFSIFHQTGHIVYAGSGHVKPIHRVSESKIIPHLFLLGGNRFSIQNSSLYVNDHQVPLTESGHILVNLIDSKILWKKSKRVSGLVKKVRAGKSLKGKFSRDDIILILPGSYTGGTDFIPTPLGVIPGGFILASLFNSALENKWLKVVEWEFSAFVFMALLGAGFGLLLPPIWWLFGSCLLFVLTVGLGVYLFVWHGYVIPWAFMAGTFSITTAVEFSIRMQKKMRERRDGMIRRRSRNEAALEVQRSLIPKHEDIKDLNCDILGGDWYGIYQPTKDSVYVFIGDVTGHGFSAALLTGAVSGSITSSMATIAADKLTIKDGLKLANRSVGETVALSSKHSGHLLTMAMIGIDLKNRTACYLNRGHNPVFQMSNDRVRSILKPGNLFGLDLNGFGFEELKFQDYDTFFLCTDGLIENQGPDGKTLSNRKILRVLRRCVGKPIADIKRQILREGSETWKQVKAADDCTFLIVQVLPRSESTQDGATEETA